MSALEVGDPVPEARVVKNARGAVTALGWLFGIATQLGITSAALVLTFVALTNTLVVGMVLVVVSLGVGAFANIGVQRLTTRLLTRPARALLAATSHEEPIPEARVIKG